MSRKAGSKTAVALIPDLETMQWHHAREEFVGQEVHGSNFELLCMHASNIGYH